ncbi:hypothetical protein QFZ20_001494 [Flavobacterium sp. W4I14]|nr:hypothetical protein [Flavobacterium sp. W4I14]
MVTGYLLLTIKYGNTNQTGSDLRAGAGGYPR